MSVEEKANEKKRACDDSEQNSAAKKARSKPLDVATELGLKAGDRLQVKWDISNDETGEVATRWWSCTLLAPEGKTIDEGQVVIRTLDYDAYPEGGFPEQSQEDVVFANSATLLNVENGEEMTFRKEGEEDEIHVLSEDGIREHLNKLLANLTESNPEWNSLPAARQAHIAELVRKGKEKLIETIVNQPSKSVITSEDIPRIFKEAFGDFDIKGN